MAEEIVICEGKPALVLGRSQNGKAVTIRFAGKILRVVLSQDVKPYEGKKDAVTLGLKDPPRKNR